MIELWRLMTSDQGTFGVVFFKGQWLWTGELPWRDNRQNVSCIPEGIYHLRIRNSPKFSWVYEVQNVPGRNYILFHHGNFCGDAAEGFRTNVQGCILLGFKKGRLYQQDAVLQSRSAREFFESTLGFNDTILKVRNVGFTL